MGAATKPAQPQESGPTLGPHVKVGYFINVCNSLKESLLDNLSGNLAYAKSNHCKCFVFRVRKLSELKVSLSSIRFLMIL